MQLQEILSKVDHTNLSQDAQFGDIATLIDEGCKYGVASVCIPPCFVSQTKEYLTSIGEKGLKLCTVIGFPNGYNTLKVKVAETEDAILSGADEIDMVININDLKAKNEQKLLNEIDSLKKVCGDRILKVIIETCLLGEDDKIFACQIISKSTADYIKTSTGFSKGGATFEDIKLFTKYLSSEKKIKASGGIKTIEQAEEYIKLGCSRLGTSSIVKLAKQLNDKEN